MANAKKRLSHRPRVPPVVPVVPVVVPVPVVGGVTRSVCLELPQGPAEGSAGAHGIAALEAPVDLERQVHASRPQLR